jgi:outer membrane protein assembly factor BamA
VAPLLLVAALIGSGLAPSQQAQAREVIAVVLVHGNQVVPTEEVITLAGVKVGDPFTDKTIADVTARLKASGKFESIDVRKRYASIEDMSQISLVILANEGPVRIDLPQLPGGEVKVVNRKVWHNLMFMPLLDGEDGYGFTYGVRVAYPQPIGPHSRLSFPLTWGGTRQAGAELDRTFKSGPISRIEFGGAIQQKVNPAYDIRDGRNRVWGRAEKVMGRVRLGSTGGYQRVSFADVIDHFTTISADATLDTRLDSSLPRNAVYVNASIEHVMFGDSSTTLPAGDGTSLNRTRVDARGYLGLFGQQILVARVLGEDVDRPAPLYMRSLLGGWSNLRGFEAGFRTGDTLLATSLEWRMPITSPLSSFGKMGVSVFVDWGTAYDHGQQLRDQKWDQGAGAAVWITITAFRMSVGVAHGKGSGTRVNFGGGLTF